MWEDTFHTSTLRGIVERVGLDPNLFSEILLNNKLETHFIFDTYEFIEKDEEDDDDSCEGYKIFAKDKPKEFLMIYTGEYKESAYALLWGNDHRIVGTYYSEEGCPSKVA